MASEGTYLTREGLTRIREELTHLLTVRRKEVADGLKRAAEVGGTVDNAEFDEANRDREGIERRIASLEGLLYFAEIIPSQPVSVDTVGVGSKVVVMDESGTATEYMIVGRAEADPLHGRISNESPVGKAILGKRLGEQAEARTPIGLVRLKIAGIR